MKRIYLLFVLPCLITLTALSSFGQSAGALPVLINLNAGLASNRTVVVSWTMLQKSNTDYFDIQKSGDGISWRSIGIVQPFDSATVPFTYCINDILPLKGINFYKVRLKDLNGNISFTAVKSVSVSNVETVKLYPNPAITQVNVCLRETPKADWSITIMNGAGQVLLQKIVSRHISMASLSVANIPKGSYILQTTEGTKTQSATLLIQQL